MRPLIPCPLILSYTLRMLYPAEPSKIRFLNCTHSKTRQHQSQWSEHRRQAEWRVIVALPCRAVPLNKPSGNEPSQRSLLWKADAK